MKQKLLLLTILFIVSTITLGLIFLPILIRINYSAVVKMVTNRTDSSYVKIWVEDKEKTEKYIRTHYPNGINSSSADDLIRFKSAIIDSTKLSFLKNGVYETNSNGFLGKIEVKGYWSLKGDYLVLEEVEKKDQFSGVQGFKRPKLVTYYYRITEKTSQTMTLFLDLDKTVGLPKDIIEQADTAFYKALQ